MAIFTVTDGAGRLVLETDDWVDAQARAMARDWPTGGLLTVKGVHPSHEWDAQRPRRCRLCDGWDNGSYGSQAPCGYDFRRESLLTVIERELAARAQAPADLSDAGRARLTGAERARWGGPSPAAGKDTRTRAQREAGDMQVHAAIMRWPVTAVPYEGTLQCDAVTRRTPDRRYAAGFREVRCDHPFYEDGPLLSVYEAVKAHAIEAHGWSSLADLDGT